MKKVSESEGLLKQELWRRYGDPSYPVEWNGQVHGGGKLSQRFWEYFKTIEFLKLDSTSVVLEIGGGSPATAPFFGAILSSVVDKVFIMDTNVPPAPAPHGSGMVYVSELATYDSTRRLLEEHPEITHISCVSVFEHIPDDVRPGIVKAINESFQGDVLAATLEFHGSHSFFEHQLTTRSASSLFAPLTNFYLTECEASPIACEDSFYQRTAMVTRPINSATPPPQMREVFTPLWYPLALKFVRGIKSSKI